MNATTTIGNLWQQFRDSIDAAYKANGANAGVLRDYAQNVSWSDDLEALLQTELVNERQHRRSSPAPKGFSAFTASKLLLMNNASKGAHTAKLPPITDFLVYRKTSVEAQVLGFIVKEHLSAEWHKQVESLDYAKLMQAA